MELPHLPEMVFPNNILYLTHVSGAQVEFNALDALRKVCNGKLPIKVACADVWKESRYIYIINYILIILTML